MRQTHCIKKHPGCVFVNGDCLGGSAQRPPSTCAGPGLAGSFWFLGSTTEVAGAVFNLLSQSGPKAIPKRAQNYHCTPGGNLIE
jgi:hypothetical protein